jgi:hypothetical protein
MAKLVRIALSTAGLRLADQLSRKDFRFVCGSDALICDRFQAAFLSPRISSSVLNDPTIEEWTFDHTDSRSFEILCKLIRGDAVVIDEENAIVFQHLINNLGNGELSEQVMEFVENRAELSVSNCVSRLEERLRLRLKISTDRESAFIASHISELKSDELCGIDIGIMSDIMRVESLQIPSEDWLLVFVFELGPKYFGLVGEICFEYLSSSSIDLLSERISFDQMDDRIWRQIWS